MPSEPFQGTVSQMKQASKFLASEDFIGRPETELEISGVYQDTGEIMQDGKKKDFFSLGFAKTQKRMVLNATNRRALAFAFGSDVSKWAGNKVKIYVQDGVRNPAGGATVCGLRLKCSQSAEQAKARRDEMMGGGQ
jgi:hypothetical protein